MTMLILFILRCIPQSDIFMHVTNLCEFVKMGLSINLCAFYLFMHSTSAYESNVLVWRNKNLCNINLCDLRLTHIIHK